MAEDLKQECSMAEALFVETLSREKQGDSKQELLDEAPNLSPLALAYVGDSIYDFRVRDYLCRRYQENLNRVNS